MNQPPINTGRPAVRTFVVVTVTATAATLGLLNTGCSLRGQKVPLWPQASADAKPAEAPAPGMAARSPVKEAPAAAMSQRKPPITLASFDRPAEENSAFPSSRSAVESAPEAAVARPPGPAAANGAPVSIAMPAPRPTVPATAAPAGEVLKATSDTFNELVVDADMPVLVDFYADWCGPCRKLSPRLQELAQELPDVRVVKVDIDESPDIAARYQVGSIPALRVFDGGKVTARHLGLTSKKHLRTLVGR
jgi:thioredoxin 1